MFGIADGTAGALSPAVSISATLFDTMFRCDILASWRLQLDSVRSAKRNHILPLVRYVEYSSNYCSDASVMHYPLSQRKCARTQSPLRVSTLAERADRRRLC